MTTSDFFTSKLMIYFTAEKHGGLIAFVLGIIALLISLYLFIYGSTYKGMLYPMALFGLIEVGVGAGLFLKTDKQVSGLMQLQAKSVAEFKKVEVPRMQKVMRNFKVLKIAWLFLIGASVALGFYFLNNDFIYSFCMGLVIQVAVLLIFDLYAEKRASAYLSYITTL